jgi:hypothetical protein
VSAPLAKLTRLCSSQNPSHAKDALTVHPWSVAQRGNIVEVGYGGGSDFPQYVALHTDSSYLRLNYGPGSGWGTSIILLPSLWVAGRYYQGGQISAACRKEGADFEISFQGSISGLRAQGLIRLARPVSNLISGTVTVNVDGDVNLDYRPREAFKPVNLSSMHISADHWDAQLAHIDTRSFQIPACGWTIPRSAVGHRFGLKGGSSTWKTNAPTLEIQLDEGREIAGWKTASFSPKDDNLGLWAATDDVIRFWQYTFTAKPYSGITKVLARVSDASELIRSAVNCLNTGYPEEKGNL